MRLLSAMHAVLLLMCAQQFVPSVGVQLLARVRFRAG